MLTGIREILVISTPEDTNNFKNLLGNGNLLGINLSYSIQKSPDGLAQAFIIGEEFIGNDDVVMILGDNIFYGNGIRDKLDHAKKNLSRGKATIFSFYVKDPERFGVVEFNNDGVVTSIEEKPKQPKSNYAVTGLYFYDKRVVEFAKRVRPSWRNELEITDINNMYLEDGSLEAITLGRGYTWMDAGTPDSMAEASSFIRMIEQHQGLKIACLEEISYLNGWIKREDLDDFVKRNIKNDYGKYVAKVLEGKVIY